MVLLLAAVINQGCKLDVLTLPFKRLFRGTHPQSEWFPRSNTLRAERPWIGALRLAVSSQKGPQS